MSEPRSSMCWHRGCARSMCSSLRTTDRPTSLRSSSPRRPRISGWCPSARTATDIRVRSRCVPSDRFRCCAPTTAVRWPSTPKRGSAPGRTVLRTAGEAKPAGLCPLVSVRRDRLGPMAAKKTLVPWNSAKPAPVVMISGGESVLVRMAKDRIVSTVRKQDPGEIEFDAAGYQAGELAMADSPSLFSTATLIVVDAVEKCSEDFLNDALAYLDDPNDDAVVLLMHAGGNRGAKLIRKLDSAGFPRVDAAVLKNESDRAKFAQNRFKAAKRRIDESGMAALMSALGSDLAELNAGVDQLIEDTEGTITAQVVDQYHGGRVEATGFK